MAPLQVPRDPEFGVGHRLDGPGRHLDVVAVGIVTEVDPERQVAYVDPDPDVSDAILQGLGFGDADSDDIEVPSEAVETVTDTEIRVSRDL